MDIIITIIKHDRFSEQQSKNALLIKYHCNAWYCHQAARNKVQHGVKCLHHSLFYVFEWCSGEARLTGL